VTDDRDVCEAGEARVSREADRRRRSASQATPVARSADWVQTGRPIPTATFGMLVIASMAWLAALQLSPTTRGLGAGLSGHELADLVGSGALGHSPPRWVGPVWYTTPIAGALLLITLAIDRPWATRARFAVATAGLAPALTLTALLTKLDLSRFGSGSWSMATGSVLAVGAVVVELVVDRRRRSRVL
jgi:hypothetical protein